MPAIALTPVGMTRLLNSNKPGTPTPHRVGRAGHGRHGRDGSTGSLTAPALCIGTDDVGLDSSVPSHQGEGTKKTQP